MTEEPLEVCQPCNGQGGWAHIDYECCGNYLPSGECCSAVHGTSFLVPIGTWESCPECRGTGSYSEPSPPPEDWS